MPFSRALVPAAFPGPAALTAAMAGIGMKFAAAPAPNPNIEDTHAARQPKAAENLYAADA